MTSEAKIISTAVQHQQKVNRPFFNKEGQGSFFSRSGDPSVSFFTPADIQAKLTVGQPNDIYEKEADALANKVLQRLSDPGSVQANPNSSIGTVTPLIQKKCAHCEEEEKLQKKADGTSQTTSSNIESRLNSSKASGSSLPQSTRDQMENTFGANFSNVRIHNDSSAVQMSQDLSAQAFTHGSDIYFDNGKYNPENKEGQFLLAHELTHVVQQQNMLQKKQIQRSFWGTVGGALLGAGAGFLAGGPIGAIIGGVAGGVAGDAVTTHTRGLNKAERQEAQKVFGSSLNYSSVSVSDSSKLMQIGGYARTPGNTVFFPTGTLGRSDPAYYTFLIHELTHTWQTQHGVSVFRKIRYSLSQSNYDFGGDAGIQKAIKDGKCFNDFNTEAQASILEKYYEILTGQVSGDGLLYYHFVSQVQNYGGRCEPAGIKEDSLDPKYRDAESQSNSFA